MTSASTIILKYVCPSLGSIVGVYMFLAPFRDIQRAVARGSLGALNPLPWAFTLGNCCGWVFYGILINDLFVMIPNMIGFFLAVWYNLAATKLLYQQQFLPLSTTTTTHASSTDKDTDHDNDDHDNDDHDKVVIPMQHSAPSFDYYVMGSVMVWSALVALIGFANGLSLDTKQWIVGLAANVNLLFFYGAPLSTIATVLQTQNTASIHFLTMVTNTANSCFWGIYGLAIVDYLIFVPNGIGALLGLIQFILYLCLPRTMMDQHSNVVMNDITEDQHDNTAVPHGTNVKSTKDVEQAEMSGLTAVDESEDLRTSSVACQPISNESPPTAATTINR